MSLFIFFILFAYTFDNPVNSEAIQLTSKNIDEILASNDLVFINFYVEWCRYCSLVQPIFDEAATVVHKEYGPNGRVAMCKVDCDAQEAIASRFKITKYPTLKASMNDDLMKREYRGRRSVDAYVEFVRDQLNDPIREFKHLDDLEKLDKKKRNIIAYFTKYDTSEYKLFRRVADNLKEDCDFHAGFATTVAEVHNGVIPKIYFRPDLDFSADEDVIYTGEMHEDELKIWARDKCIPLVREITFENAEGLTEEGMPFMILFYNPDNLVPIKMYKSVIEAELVSEKQNINFLIADGKTFAHPLEHLAKGLDDLPVIAIDSFRHMYLFPDYNDIFVGGKLAEFVADLHSGKLHREFHYGPDPVSAANSKSQNEDEHENEQENVNEDEDENENENEHEQKHDQSNHSDAELSSRSEDIKVDELTEESPPDSTFIKLAPSDKRYTLLRNEL